ncbi:MAG: amino-acid N-acetyltransferase [Puniceicoccales bacterium]|jgi:amino-acid N-acetyltransferase|nr:amino-acid N-acetyltransferase [Puniceicoccales bacterium]
MTNEGCCHKHAAAAGEQKTGSRAATSSATGSAAAGAGASAAAAGAAAKCAERAERARNQIKPADLRGILEYVPMFRDHVFVIAIDGVLIEDEGFPDIVTDIAVLRSLNIRVVIVHGIGAQLREAAARRGLVTGDVYGEGPTDAATLALARETSGVVTQTIVEALTHSGLKTAVTNAVRATEAGILRGRDQLFTGKVEKIDAALVKNLLAQEIIPVFTPILCDREGRSLRINSDLLAAELAIALGASKLIFLTNYPGLVIDGKVTVNIPLDRLTALFREKRAHSIAERLRSKASHAIRALENGGATRAHILDGRIVGGLLTEIFDKVGLGTMIHANDYERIRPAKKKDARAIYNITKSGVRDEMLLPRTRAHIEQHIDEYFVYEIDESVIGCACLRRYGDSAMEAGSVFVQPFYHGRGVGKKLVEYAELLARNAGARRLYALTTQSHGFFRDVCGFSDVSVDDLPPARRAEALSSGRHARVLLKNLGTFTRAPRATRASRRSG